MTNFENSFKSYSTQNRYFINQIIIITANKLGLRQIDLVNQTGIKSSKMSKIFNKTLKPTMEDLELLSSPLGIQKETLWIMAGYMLPPHRESQIIDDLDKIENLLSLINNEQKDDPYLFNNIKLTATEKSFINEYIEFVQYRKNKGKQI